MVANETSRAHRPLGARSRRRFMSFAVTALILGLGPVGLREASANDDCDGQGSDHGSLAKYFVHREGSRLKLHNKEFRFAGTNNYYLGYQSKLMVDSVLTTAASQGFSTLRFWGFIDIGNQDGSNSLAGKPNGVYFQYWNGKAPAYNDGADGLQHLDYVIYRAGQLGIRLVIPFTNNWGDFGGMDQYVAWAGGQYHDQFYTNATVRKWYKGWISHLVEHKNMYTGVAYKDDPTIMTWELGNEPRCQGSGAYPTSASCTTTTLTAWADEMSKYVSKVDNKHLVSVGDEGFYCTPGGNDWTENCGSGVDSVALGKLPKIDVVSYHLYPDGWGKDVAWGQDWIERHVASALGEDKPAMMGEFGLKTQSTRNPNYKLWTDTLFDVGGAGALFWMLADKQDDGTLYPDYDGFTVYCPGPVCSMLSHFSADMAESRSIAFAPVADHDVVATPFETPVMLDPLANDVAYDNATVVPGLIDLDPIAAGQQTTLAVAGGVFKANADGTVMFTPASGVSGTAVASYVVQDTKGRLSNVATLTVTVATNVNAAIGLASFESGTEGWGPASWDPGAATAQQTTDFHTLGSYGLAITPSYGEWFGVSYGTPVDISTKTHLKVDVQTTSAGTSQELAIQAGSGWTWCQAGGWGWVNGSTSTTMDFDLGTLDCGAADLTQVHAVYLYLGNGGAGTIYLDNVRAE